MHAWRWKVSVDINCFIMEETGNITIGEESCDKGELYCYALMPYCLLYETKIWLTYTLLMQMEHAETCQV